LSSRINYSKVRLRIKSQNFQIRSDSWKTSYTIKHSLTVSWMQKCSSWYPNSRTAKCNSKLISKQVWQLRI